VVGEFWQCADRHALEDTWVAYFAEKCRQYSRAYWGWINYDWLIAEGENICTIVDHALTGKQEKTALVFSHPLILYLDITGREIELKEYSESLYFRAQITKDKRLQAWFNVYVFGWYVPPGEEKQAEQCVSKGLKLYDELDDQKGRWFAMTRLGRIARMMGKYDDSEQHYTTVLKEAQVYGDAYGVADACFGLGNLSIAQQDWENAKGYFENVIEWCEKEADDEERADISFWQTTCSKLGWVEYNLGHYERGKELLEDSLLFLKQIGGKRNFINVHLRLARVEEALGNPAIASEHGQQALFWAERLGIQQKHKEALELLSEIVSEINHEE
jgi:tetratricopeptide (TPR) repeat protein